MNSTRIFYPIIIVLLITAALLALSAGAVADKTKTPPNETTDTNPALSIETPPVSNAPEIVEVDNTVEIVQVETPVQNPPTRAEQVMKAIAQAYPDRVGPAQYRNEDWAVPIGEKWFYYAEGRMLPEELHDRIAEYSSQPFYNYVAELPPWTAPSEEENARMSGTLERQEQQLRSPIQRSTQFFDALWRASNRDESYDRVKTMRFLGFQVMVHYSIMEELALVEEAIQNAAKTSASLRTWIAGIDSVSGWSWRNISSTQSRSFHSYGAAIDILPKSLGGKATYWLWTAEYNPQWWAVPYSQRYHPPQEVITAFESFGFVWGGKWMVYDTMHFEYRPEIMILNDMPLVDTHTLF